MASPSRPSGAQRSWILSSTRLATSNSCNSGSSSISSICCGVAFIIEKRGKSTCPTAQTPAKQSYLLFLLPLKDKTNTVVLFGNLDKDVGSFRQHALLGELFQIGAGPGQAAGAQVAGCAFQTVGRF